MSATTANQDNLRSNKRHRSYRDRPRASSQTRIPIPLSDPVPVPQSPQFERQPATASRSRISSPRKVPRRNAAPVYQAPPLPDTYSHGVAHFVATGEVGLNYGPYQYHQGEASRARARIQKEPTDPEKQAYIQASAVAATEAAAVPRPNPVFSDRPMSTPNSATVPQYIWDNDKQVDPYLDNDYPQDKYDFNVLSWRGFFNIGALSIIIATLMFLFIMWPILDHYVFHPPINFAAPGVNASGQIPQFESFPSVIDVDTPQSAYYKIGTDGEEYELVFSDEFSLDGRSFYPGDDPYWEAADLHYWATNNLEWYDPQAVTTLDGHLVITINETKIHDLEYMGGMITSWNKLCFTTGYVETSISLPGSSRVPGLWPGAWSLGNLGRAGYGASTEGMWPYSYDSCDVGTFPNQTTRDGQPRDAVVGGYNGDPISYQPGQRASACTCPGHDHPGPVTTRGRGVPEIDILEAQVELDLMQGEVSQSFQIAPYDYQYYWTSSSPATTIYNESITKINSYRGGHFQEAISALTLVDEAFYEGYAYATYGYEWWSNPDKRDEGYITWFSNDQPTWTITSASVAADTRTLVNNRLIPEEPMYLILNLGMSNFFQTVDFTSLKFPVSMYVDYVRVYQRKGVKDGLTCDPPSYPTKDYINNHLNAYMNPNLTTWSSAGYTFPRNSIYDGCE